MYRVVYGLLWLISLLPLWVLYLLSDLMYVFAHRFYRRDVVRTNLKNSFPDKTDEEIAEIEKKFYRVFCDYFAEDIKSFSISKKEMMRRVKFDEEGINWIKSQYDGGKDFVFVTMGHYCNWEWMASFTYWMPFAYGTQLYSPLQNQTMDQVFLKLRQRYGGECISKEIAARRILKLRAEGKKVLVAFIADQLPQWKGIHHFVEFLHQDTAVFTGAEQLGKKLNASMVYASFTRNRRGYYQAKFIPLTDAPKSLPDYEITDKFMSLLEKDIVTTPHLWLWSHKRWRRTREQWLERQREMEQRKHDLSQHEA
ncbi:MAG: lysophospholipid acyltransferase family protein [Bacteroidales bacterium]|nr:lysophospholipid acyltransferase family protein [Bacteroidales bacterium]